MSDWKSDESVCPLSGNSRRSLVDSLLEIVQHINRLVFYISAILSTKRRVKDCNRGVLESKEGRRRRGGGQECTGASALF